MTDENLLNEIGRACLAATLFLCLGTKIADAQAPSSAIAFYPAYCKDLTGKTDCSSGFARWISAGISQHRPLYARAGKYRLSSAQVVQLHPVAGIGLSVFCDGPKLTRFVFDRDVGSPNLEFIGLDTPGNADSINYLWIQGCGFSGSTNGTLVQIGRMDFGDAINETQLVNDGIYNGSGGDGAIALQLNFVLNSFINIVADAGAPPPSEKAPPFKNLGFAALDCRGCAFNSFFGSYSIANSGIVLRDWQNYGNVFHSVDAEVTNASVSVLNSGSVDNTFIGGQFSSSVVGINATAGAGNKFINPHFFGNVSDTGALVGVTIQ